MDESLPYRIAYSTGAEQCKKCRLQIEEASIQIAIMAQSNLEDVKHPVWYHRECFLKVRLPQTEAAFDGFAQLRYEHQMALRNDLGIEIEPQAKDLEEEICKQNKQYFAIYDYIEKNVSNREKIVILKENGQTVSAADIAQTPIIHQLSDIICFGALAKCLKCRSGELRFSNWCYRCSNPMQWSTYCNEVCGPQRSMAKIPENMLKTHSFLEKNKRLQVRVMHQFRFFDEHNNDLVYGPYKKPPFLNMEFVLIGDFTMARADMERIIKKMGGKIATWVHARVAAVISNASEVRKMDKQMKDARMYDIQVVSEDFISKCQSPDVDPIWYILEENICDWGGYAYDRILECNDAVARMEEDFDNSMSKNTTYKWKGGAAIDPECGLGDNVHVYSTKVASNTVYYSAILGYVDIQSNKNSYYRLQLLEANRKNAYWLFESWGRIGTTICSKKLQTFPTLQQARVQYCTVYHSKTGNDFNSRTFQKHPNKFYHLDVDVELPVKPPQIFNPTSLSKPVYDLMKFLFDIKDLGNTMVGCDLDLKEMPLGKISTKQLKLATLTLQNIMTLIRQNANTAELLAASNEFYTLLPHAFGINRLPIIRSIDMVNAKCRFLEDSFNVDMIQDFLGGANVESMHPYDLCYLRLHVSIEPIEKHTHEFQQLCGIVRNLSQHTQLEVLEIFKVQREAEADRNGNCHINFKYRNHQLLWHGSRLLNFANILSNGLKITPPEAISSGQAYGNGIYFTDAVLKAATYCRNDLKNNVGLMLLCEVALGIAKIAPAFGMPISSIEDGVVPVSHPYMRNPGNLIYLPNDDYQSIQAFATGDSIGYQEIDGVRIANGNSIQNGMYNEFIVFDPNQVKIKYLFKLKFK